MLYIYSLKKKIEAHMNFFIDFSIKFLHIQISLLNIFVLIITEINLLLTLYEFLIYMKRQYIFYLKKKKNSLTNITNYVTPIPNKRRERGFASLTALV